MKNHAKGMLKNSAPPIIILLDVLFIFMFSSLLEKNHSIDLELSGVPPKSGILLYRNIGNSQQIRINNSWLPMSETAPKLKIKYFQTFQCKKGCIKYLNPSSKNDRIILFGELYNRVANINFLACVQKNSSCNSMKIFVNSTGIDKKTTLLNNEELEKISGVKNHLN